MESTATSAQDPDFPLTRIFLTDGLFRLFSFIKKDRVPAEYFENVEGLFKTDPIEIDRERFNIILSSWYLPPAGKKFFHYYFGSKIKGISQLKAGVEKFIKDALWHFGDLQRAYLALKDEDDLRELFTRHKFHGDEFTGRLPWNVIEPIEPMDRGYLGYVSGQTEKEENALTAAQLVVAEIDRERTKYETLSQEERTTAILAKLAEKDPEIKTKINEVNQIESIRDLDLFSAKQLEENKAKIAAKLVEVKKEQEKVDNLKAIGFKNQQHYLRNLEMIDVYVATSMRTNDEYLEMYDFVHQVFASKRLKPLNLRYFDPTLAYCESRIDKGLVESLLVRSAKVTIYCAQKKDTFGKDSELASTLALGKPAIVYVPFVEGKAELDERATMFREFHPLGLQAGINDGVARGVIVVRTAEQCSRILYKILTNTLDVSMNFEEYGIVLREVETGSVLRVATGWGILASVFWHNFERTKTSKSGLPFHDE